MEGNPPNGVEKQKKIHEAPDQLGSQLPQELFDKIHQDFNELVRQNRLKKDITTPLVDPTIVVKARQEVDSMTNEEIISTCKDPLQYSLLVSSREKFALVYTRLQLPSTSSKK